LHFNRRIIANSITKVVYFLCYLEYKKSVVTNPALPYIPILVHNVFHEVFKITIFSGSKFNEVEKM